MTPSFLNKLSGTHLNDELEDTVLKNLRTLFNTLAPYEHTGFTGISTPMHLNSTLNYGLPDVLRKHSNAGDVEHYAQIKKNIIAAIHAFEPRLKQVSLEWNNTQEEMLSFIITGQIEAHAIKGKTQLVAHGWCDSHGHFFLK